MANILIASDGERPAIHAARTVSQLVDSASSFTVLTVVADSTTAFLDGETVEEHDREMEVEAESSPGLRETIDVLGRPAELRVTHGDPGREIVDAATTEDADLVVVGARRGKHVGNLLHRSVSRYLVGHLRCPVLVVPMPEGSG